MKRKRGRKKKKKKAGWWQNLQVVPILTYLWNINLSSIPIAGEEAVLDRTENFSKAMERGGWGGSMLDRSIQRGSERKQLAACPWSCGHYAPSYIHYIYIYMYIIFSRGKRPGTNKMWSYTEIRSSGVVIDRRIIGNMQYK